MAYICKTNVAIGNSFNSADCDFPQYSRYADARLAMRWHNTVLCASCYSTSFFGLIQ